METTRRHRRTALRRGFTLIETALATVIVGTGVVAIIAAHQSFFRQNEWATLASLAQRLGVEVREFAFHLPHHDPVTGFEPAANGQPESGWGPEPGEEWDPTPGGAETLLFDDLDDFDGAVFSSADGTGPIDALGRVIPEMDGWSQRIYVENVDPFNLTSVQPHGTTEMMKVTVVIEYRKPGTTTDATMTSVTWVAPR
jgi:prepilin-type N-terminal cleavage/methylation domain-containing protein